MSETLGKSTTTAGRSFFFANWLHNFFPNTTLDEENYLVLLPGVDEHIGTLAHARIDSPPGDKWLPETGVVIDPVLFPELAANSCSRAPTGCTSLGIAAGKLYFAAGSGYSVLFRTSDGLTFERVTTPVDGFYNEDGDGYYINPLRIIASFGDTIIIGTKDLLPSSGQVAVLRSTDAGETWEISQIAEYSGSITAMTYNDDGSMLVAAIEDNGIDGLTIWTSADDGVTWIQRETIEIGGEVAGSNCLRFHDGIYVLLASDGDGVDSSFTTADPTGAWTENATPIVEAYARWNGMESNGSLLVAVGQENQGGSAGIIMSSPDGLTWTKRLEGTAGGFGGVTYSLPLLLWIAAGRDGVLYTSPDGITWTSRTSGTSGHFSAIAAFGANVYAFDDTNNDMRKSSNGTAWSAIAGFDPHIYYTPYVNPIGDEDDLFTWVRVLD